MSISLVVEWDKAFPSETVTIGDVNITIRPMGIQDLFSMASNLGLWIQELQGSGINKDNWDMKENMERLLNSIAFQSTHLIARASGIEERDFNRLPASYQFAIISAVIDVNMRDWEVFSKNCHRLTKSLRRVYQSIPEEFRNLVTSFSSSLKTGILGQTLNTTA